MNKKPVITLATIASLILILFLLKKCNNDIEELPNRVNLEKNIITDTINIAVEVKTDTTKEKLLPDTVSKIIEKEKPDTIPVKRNKISSPNTNEQNIDNTATKKSNEICEIIEYSVKVFDKTISLVFVEGGTYLMGCTSEQNDCYDNEYPVKQVTVSDFYIGKYHITNALFVLFLNDIGVEPSGNYKGVFLFNNKWSETINYRGVFYVEPGYSQHPVNFVTYNGVQEFCKWLSLKTNKKFRLPTEEEWEYAARGGVCSKGYTYPGSNNRDEVAWYSGNSRDEIHAVGTKKPNELGIYDMVGNVSDICSNVASEEVIIQHMGEPYDNLFYISKGGCFYTDRYTRISFKGCVEYDKAYRCHGFRLVCDL